MELIRHAKTYSAALAVFVAQLSLTNANGESICCAALSLALREKVSYSNSTAYDASIASYWSAEEQGVLPTCFVSPTTTKDVSIAIAILTTAFDVASGRCQFAIKGAGHTPWASAANIQNGVTIDLGAMNQVMVSESDLVVSIGAGAKWIDVYSYLDPKGLTVPGGRVAGVGVGGLTLGGGISFNSERVGFACDNVVNYEIVLANGFVTNANKNQNSDLWLALKGGSNNFGVVTRFDFQGFAQGTIWGGRIIFDLPKYYSQSIQAFHNFDNETGYDPSASNIASFIWAVGYNFVGVNYLVYTEEVAYAPAFADYEAIPKEADTTRFTTVGNLTQELQGTGPNGAAVIFITSTFQNDLGFLFWVYEQWTVSVGRLNTSVAGLEYSMVWEPLPPAITDQSVSRGGNVLGLESPANPALVLFLVSVSWADRSDDARVDGEIRSFITHVEAEANARGLFHPFKYLNYALPPQDPIRGYGAANVAKLKAASRKYDPRGLFQEAVPGGFKLFA